MGEVFEVPKLSTSVGGLTIKVDPEIGMRTKAGEQGLRLWLGIPPMAARYSEIFHYLLGKASKEPDWPAQWHLNVWDVRRQVILLPPHMPDDIEDRVTGHGLDWLRMIDAGSE